MAAKLGVAVSTIQGWKQRGRIPAERREALLAVARRLGVPLAPDDFLEPGEAAAGGSKAAAAEPAAAEPPAAEPAAAEPTAADSIGFRHRFGSLEGIGSASRNTGLAPTLRRNPSTVPPHSDSPCTRVP